MLSDERTGSEPVALGKALEERALQAAGRLREQGKLGRSEAAQVDWTSGEGQARLAWLMRVAGVPEEYRDVEWERCRVEHDVRRFTVDMEAVSKAGRGAIVMGPVGTGKSSTAALVVREACKRRLKVRWSYVPDLCDQMLVTFRRQEVRSQQMAPDLLVWDDFGVRPFSEFELGVLDQIVEGRYRRKKSMVITTNLNKEGLVDDRRFARMVDRWRQRNEAWVIEGASQRRFGA